MSSNRHLVGFTADDAGEVTLLVGDPGRVALFAELLTQAQEVTRNREFIAVTGYYHQQRVSIVSTGIGIGSTEIAVIELLQSGAKRLVRIGGCGAWQPLMQAGDIVMNVAMARTPGMLASYVPESYPAVADPQLFMTINQALCHASFIVHQGIGLTTDSYYHAQGRSLGLLPTDETDRIFTYWQQRKILNAEMETAIIYLLASLYQVPAANCLVVHVDRESGQWISGLDYQKRHLAVADVVLNSIIERR